MIPWSLWTRWGPSRPEIGLSIIGPWLMASSFAYIYTYKPPDFLNLEFVENIEDLETKRIRTFMFLGLLAN